MIWKEIFATIDGSHIHIRHTCLDKNRLRSNPDALPTPSSASVSQRHPASASIIVIQAHRRPVLRHVRRKEPRLQKFLARWAFLIGPSPPLAATNSVFKTSRPLSSAFVQFQLAPCDHWSDQGLRVEVRWCHQWWLRSRAAVDPPLEARGQP